MTAWILPVALLGVIWAATTYLARLIARATGRSTKLSSGGRTLTAVGAGICVLLFGATLQLDLPWLFFVSGVSFACISLVLQPYLGNPDP
jgi:hypothetical protein